MTKHEFSLPDGRLITSVVMFTEEYNKLCDLIKEIITTAPPINMSHGQRMSAEDVERLREAQHVPMVARGTLTARVFEQYDIPTNLASFIVRGQAENVFFKYFGA